MERVDIPNHLNREFTVETPNQVWCGVPPRRVDGTTAFPAPAPKEAPAPKLSTSPKVSPLKTPKLSAKAPPQSGGEEPANLPALSQRDRELMLGRRPVGRPTEYRPDLVPELIFHFDIEVTRAVEVDVVGKDGKTYTEKKIVHNTFPALTRFAAKIGMTRQTLHDWATAKDKDGALKHLEFSYAYARAKDAQEYSVCWSRATWLVYTRPALPC